VTSVAVTCTSNLYTVGGTISGLTGAGLVLKDVTNSHQVTVLAGATTFTIAPGLANGTSYSIQVLTQPAGQNCTVTSGATGSVTTANVTNVAVTCTNLYTIGGTISGLTGTGLVLKDSVSGHTTVPPVSHPATTFTITPGVATGATYNVSVLTQPSTPAQFCRVTAGSSTVAAANITSVAVTCKNVGQVVFVANPFDTGPAPAGLGTLAAFTINPLTGALTTANGTVSAPAVSVAVSDEVPSGLALDPDGTTLYVADFGETAVTPPPYDATGANIAPWTFTIAGVLTEGTPVAMSTTTIQPASLAIDVPSGGGGPYLYAGDNDNALGNNGNVAAFNATAGVLSATELTGSPYAGGNTPLSIAVDETQTFVFAPNFYDGTVSVYSIGAGGVLANVTEGGTPGSPFPLVGLTAAYGVAASPTALFFYVTDQSTTPGTVTQFSYDGTTGAVTQLSSYNVGTTPWGVTIDPTGQFLYVSNSDNNVYGFKVAPTTGVLTTIAGSPFANGAAGAVAKPTGAAVDPSSQYLYATTGDAATTNGGSVAVFSINQTTGALTPGTPVLAVDTPGAGASAIIVK
jgi:6-phosphogluconolactonase (cycloisomerase 2 family)